MALPLHDRALETDSQDFVRMTLLDGGASARLVEALIPSRPLEAGEQYRFHFDMTKCIGCRSCEVACNEQNGNPADIKWRRVGELEGGVYPDTQRTYLSMGCNHCLSADCLKGCPVDAYTKDPSHRHRPALRRRLHRLPVLRLELPLQRPAVQPRTWRRRQV